MPSGERILIVESDPVIADLLARQALQPLGYQVTVEGEAASALKHALRTLPDLILANINLPGLSGKDLIAALNSQGIKSPLIVIAENGQEANAIQAFRLGATDVLFWPLQDAEVVSIVERVLRQTEEARERQKLERQLKTANNELQGRLKDLSTILTTAKAVVSMTNQRQLFNRLLESALQLGEADVCWLTLRDEKTKVFLLRAHRNLPANWAKKMDQPLDDGISSLVTHSGESLLMNGEPLQKFKIAELGKSVGVIPIKIKTEVIGLLMVARREEREFSRDEQAKLEAMADYASISLVNARLFQALEQTAENARTAEKHRYASLESLRAAIHNETQAALYLLNMVMSETNDLLKPNQRKALESIRSALHRLTRSSEKTVAPSN